MSYSPETHFSSLAPPPLRSAMKHSRPSTPAPPGSPVLRYSSPLLAASPPPAGPSRSVTHTPVGSFNGSLSPMLTPHSPSPVVNQGYTPKVGFDTFENPQASMFSYTLHVQNEGYSRNKNTRVFLVAASPDESGSQALDWVLENLVQDGDELIVFRGADSDDLGECSGVLRKLACGGCNICRFSPAHADKEQDVYREEARELMRQVQDKCMEYDPERKVRGVCLPFPLCLFIRVDDAQHIPSVPTAVHYHRVYRRRRARQHRPPDRAVSARLACRRLARPARDAPVLGRSARWVWGGERIQVRVSVSLSSSLPVSVIAGRNTLTMLRGNALGFTM